SVTVSRSCLQCLTLYVSLLLLFLYFFFFNLTATTEIYTLSLHDALPISASLISSPDQKSARFCILVIPTIAEDTCSTTSIICEDTSTEIGVVCNSDSGAFCPTSFSFISFFLFTFVVSIIKNIINILILITTNQTRLNYMC